MRGIRGLLDTAVHPGSPTPLNVEVGPHRRFDWTHLPFEDVHEIEAYAERLGGCNR